MLRAVQAKHPGEDNGRRRSLNNGSIGRTLIGEGCEAMELVIWVSLAFALGWFAGRTRRNRAENRGEAAVRRLLSATFPDANYHLLNSITLPDGEGTTQIDHILVSRFGVFVIETKHYNHWIVAPATSPQWTQVIYKKQYKFQNPLHQNRKHVGVVRELLDFLPAEHVHSVVVFTGNPDFKTQRPPGVFLLSELAESMRRYDEEVLSENRLQFCVGRLEWRRKALTQQTDVEHVEHLRRKFGDTA
jgi:hypothetical protein